MISIWITIKKHKKKVSADLRAIQCVRRKFAPFTVVMAKAIVYVSHVFLTGEHFNSSRVRRTKIRHVLFGLNWSPGKLVTRKIGHQQNWPASKSISIRKFALQFLDVQTRIRADFSGNSITNSKSWNAIDFRSLLQKYYVFCLLSVVLISWLFVFRCSITSDIVYLIRN